jgi:hypothetical protein
MATNTQNSRMGMGTRNSKRKLEEFATPPKWEYYKIPKEPKEQTIAELFAAGSDLANIMSSVCQLTNNIYPIFRDENLCFCEYAQGHDCVASRFAANSGWIPRIPQQALPYQKDRIILRNILQLASQMITHPQTLPFWAGLIDAPVLAGVDNRAAFEVHPTRLLEPARQARTLKALENFANSIRVHFKDFVYEGTITPEVSGYAPIEYVRKTDPYYREDVAQYYAWRDDRTTIESGSPPFLHLFINLRESQCLRPYEALMGMTITDMKVDMFGIASTICHEFSHALEQHYCDRFDRMPRMNDELLVETGYSLEAFLYGGTYSYEYRKGKKKPCIKRWPSAAMYEFYKSNNHPMEMHPFADLGPDRRFPIESRKCAVFLEQSFWDDPKPPAGCLKKMWLKPHCEVALDQEDYDYFNSGSRHSRSPRPKKRRRLSDAAMERKRASDANGKREDHRKVEVRWHLKKEVLEERKAVFYEREMVKLNGLWEKCMEGIVSTW